MIFYFLEHQSTYNITRIYSYEFIDEAHFKSWLNNSNQAYYPNLQYRQVPERCVKKLGNKLQWGKEAGNFRSATWTLSFPGKK